MIEAQIETIENEINAAKAVETSMVKTWYECSHCYCSLEVKYVYCPICGRKINWSGE
jgi:hypothetical protein